MNITFSRVNYDDIVTITFSQEVDWSSIVQSSDEKGALFRINIPLLDNRTA